jgi:hypothetical protein
MTERSCRAIVVVLAGLLAGCETQKSSNPLSPSVAGPIPGVTISSPKPLEPGAGWQLQSSDQPVTLLAENASSNGQRPLTYTFQIAADAAFSNIVFTREGVAQGEAGRTSFRLPDALLAGQTYYWRVRAQDGANTGSYSTPVSFVIEAPVVLAAPVLVSPISGEKISSAKPTFRFRVSSRSGPAGTVTYGLEVSANESFTSKYGVWVVPEQATDVSFSPVLEVPYDKAVFWRVRAQESYKGVISNWSATGLFYGPDTPPAPAPTPTPTPTPGGGSSCGQKTPLAIVECRRSQYGHMSSSEVVSFLRGVAKDLNANGIGGGPFGLLRKSGGSSCNGYSCDIICADQGTAQRQWDVLGDAEGAQSPGWSGPSTYPNIRVDTCDIQ